MRRIPLPRAPVLFWITAAGVVALHLYLCNGAILCRGHPPLEADALIACFIAPFFTGFPALFDDRRSSRRSGIIWMSIGLGFVYGAVSFNLDSPRPHPGTSLGFIGLVTHFPFWTVLHSIIPSAILFGCLHYYERVIGDCWSIARRFRDE